MTDANAGLADKIIADYKEHYDFPPQGESHMHDCIMDALLGLRREQAGAVAWWNGELDLARHDEYVDFPANMKAQYWPLYTHPSGDALLRREGK